MGKSSIFFYLTLTLLLLIFLSLSTTKHSDHRHRRLKLRSTFPLSSDHHRPVSFDPVIAEIERRREEKEWESQSHHSSDHHHNGWEDFIDAEDYLNDEDKFNVTDRIISLFPRIDDDPSDGFISLHELTQWNLHLALRDLFHRAERELELHDKDRDGFVSFSEYQPPTWTNIADKDSLGNSTGWWTYEHFNASDVDGNGLLNLTEYVDFLHPAETKNPKLLEWLSREEVRERDVDKDGKINYAEFFLGLYDLIKTYDEGILKDLHSDISKDASARMMFNQLDKDDDSHLSAAELLPIIGKIHPPDRYYAQQQANYMLSQADSDKDGRLSLAEMIQNPYVFYGAIFDEEDPYDYHDELR